MTEDAQLEDILAALPAMLQKDLLLNDISPELVIAAADRLGKSMQKEELAAVLIAAGMGKKTALQTARKTIAALSRDALQKKLIRELGEKPFEFAEIEKGIWEKFEPLGILTHIAAGNAAGLPAISVLEGLLAGNINLLKLPSADDGLSTLLLTKLIESEPRLAPYIYVFDIPSQDIDSIKALIGMSDAVAIWGSDAAISGVRTVTPPNIPIIEWGHRLSFGYVSPKGECMEALEGLAVDICETEQLLCSAPQCIYYETEDNTLLFEFAKRFADVLAKTAKEYPLAKIDLPVQAGITAAIELARMEAILGEKCVIQDPELNWSVLVDYDASLKPSPMFRNVWIKPVTRNQILMLFRQAKGYLQTAGLCCAADETQGISGLLYKAGINRITPCGTMSQGYMGEPHDGSSALMRYTRRVSRRQI